MRLKNISEIDNFIKVVNECTGDVWLESPAGDKFNLKSRFSQYIAIGSLINAEGENLELYCSNYEDEARLLKFFDENPSVLKNVKM